MAKIDLSRLPSNKKPDFSGMPDQPGSGLEGGMESLMKRVEQEKSLRQSVNESKSQPMKSFGDSFLGKFIGTTSDTGREGAAGIYEASRKGFEEDLPAGEVFFKVLGNMAKIGLSPMKGLEDASSPYVDPVIEGFGDASQSFIEGVADTSLGKKVGEFQQSTEQPIEDFLSGDTPKKLQDEIVNIIEYAKKPENKENIGLAGNIIEFLSYFAGGSLAKKPIKEGIDMTVDAAQKGSVMLDKGINKGTDLVKQGYKKGGEILEPIVKEGIQKGGELVDQGIKKVDNMVIAGQEKKLDKVVGQIAQGGVADKERVAAGLGNIDTKGVKKFSELKERADEGIDSLKLELDDLLDADGRTLTKDQLIIKTDVNGKTVELDAVSKALDQLESLYTKTDDPVSAQKIMDLKEKLEMEGLTLREINDLAKEHGTRRKAFSPATGAAPTSVSKQSFENVRKGLKETTRTNLGDDAAKAIDKKISELITVKELAEKMEEKANKLFQKLGKRNIIEKLSGGAADLFNAMTFGGPKAFLVKLMPSNKGNKVMNSMQMEKQLKNWLKKFEKIDKSLKGKADKTIDLIEKLVK